MKNHVLFRNLSQLKKRNRLQHLIYNWVIQTPREKVERRVSEQSLAFIRGDAKRMRSSLSVDTTPDGAEPGHRTMTAMETHEVVDFVEWLKLDSYEVKVCRPGSVAERKRVAAERRAAKAAEA